MAKAQREVNPTSRKSSPRGTHDAATTDQCPPLETLGELFGDGRSIELIRDTETGRLNLLLSDGENCTLAPRVEYMGRVYVPADLSPSILRAVTWPTKCTDYGSTETLFTAVRESFTNHGFPEEVALPTTYFALPTWFPECLPAAPCLSIAGPRPEANLLLQLLACLVRHALPLAEVSRAGLCSLPMDLQSTLLIDQEHLSPSTRRLLSTSNNPNAYVPWKAGLVNVYCPKAIYQGNTLGNGLFGDAAVHINLAPSRGRLPMLDEKARQEIATALQPQLVAYRSRNIAKVRESTFDLPGFASPIRILARVLGACIVDAPELQAGLIPFLEDHQEKIRAERWVDLRCVVIEALVYYCHSAKKDRVHVGEIAAAASTILKARGEIPPSDPKPIGGILRFLQFSPKRDSQGYAIQLTDRARRRIHRLARDFDVAAVQQGVTLCPHCSEIAAAGENWSEPKSEEEE